MKEKWSKTTIKNQENNKNNQITVEETWQDWRDSSAPETPSQPKIPHVTLPPSPIPKMSPPPYDQYFTKVQPDHVSRCGGPNTAHSAGGWSG